MSDPTMRMIRTILGMPADDDAYEPDDPKRTSWVDDVEDATEQWQAEQ